MKARYDIYYAFLTDSYSYGMFNNLTQAEIAELTVISENMTFRTLLKRHDMLQKKISNMKELKKVPYYQLMRSTVVLMVTHLEEQLATCRSLRVRAIVSGYLRTLLDKMEYHANFYQWRFVNLINAFPNLSDAELANHCIANKIHITDDPKFNNDIDRIINVLKYTREKMGDSSSVSTCPITQHESIYAARWLEIFERQK